jgi:hypothetical protein
LADQQPAALLSRITGPASRNGRSELELEVATPGEHEGLTALAARAGVTALAARAGVTALGTRTRVTTMATRTRATTRTRAGTRGRRGGLAGAASDHSTRGKHQQRERSEVAQRTKGTQSMHRESCLHDPYRTPAPRWRRRRGWVRLLSTR